MTNETNADAKITPLSNYRSNTSITIRVDLLQQADQLADSEGISRSALFELAIKEYVEKRRERQNKEDTQ